jgi:hypothetical protein
MNRVKLIVRNSTFAIIAAYCCFVFSGCVYDVPITAKPTHKIDERLLGDWTSKEGKDKKTNKMKIVRVDDYNYVVSYNGDLYRAYHSDVAKTAFVSVQILDSAKPKYAYSAWKLSDDGTLIGRAVSDKVIPDETKDSASVQKLLEKNLQNPALFEEEVPFTKDK